ncbi:MAG TPA: MFS transporter [Terriglobales bacterium]
MYFLSGGLAIDYLARLSLFSVLPLLKKDLALDNVAIGLLGSSFLWTYGLLSPFAGLLGDRFPRRRVLVASVAAWSVLMLLSYTITQTWELIGVRVLLGVAQVPYMPCAQALLADHHPSDSRGRASALYQLGYSVGILLAGLPAAFVATHFHWRVMLAVCGLLGLFWAFLLHKILPLHPHPPPSRPQKIPSVQAGPRISTLLRSPSMLALTAAFTLASIVYWVIFTYLPLFIYEQYNLSVEAAALRATVDIQLSTMASLPIVATVSDKLTRRDSRSRYLVPALSALAGVPALVTIGTGKHVMSLAAGLIVFGFVTAACESSWLPLLCNNVPAHQRATGYGILNFAGTIAGGVASMGTALLMKGLGLRFLISSLGALYVLIAACLLLCGIITQSQSSVTEKTAPTFVGQN